MYSIKVTVFLKCSFLDSGRSKVSSPLTMGLSDSLEGIPVC